MTLFTFSTRKGNSELQVGMLPDLEIKTLSISKMNSLPPLEKSKSLSYTTPKGVVISSLDSVILSKKGTGGVTASLNSGVKEYAERSEIILTFIDLISTAETLGQEKNSKILRTALIDIIDVHPAPTELNRQFDATAFAKFHVGIPKDGDPSMGGEISLRWSFHLKRIITQGELNQLKTTLLQTIKEGAPIKYKKT